MGLSFGYNAYESDDMLISVPDLIALLVGTVANNGNLLLNIGPKADGTIPEEQVRRLGGVKLALMAQIRVQKFYEKNGYTPVGEPCDDEGCPHIWMEKML